VLAQVDQLQALALRQVSPPAPRVGPCSHHATRSWRRSSARTGAET
jgi:hypothetical protein